MNLASKEIFLTCAISQFNDRVKSRVNTSDDKLIPKGATNIPGVEKKQKMTHFYFYTAFEANIENKQAVHFKHACKEGEKKRIPANIGTASGRSRRSPRCYANPKSLCMGLNAKEERMGAAPLTGQALL